ncbi:transglutaminase-like domain-containing protein [Aquabacterium sp.]|uniref:transglutaminase-like domain-containing protein n=1 Tax=Aquabacterium sp. TaxID=1872578 RepID=UPI003D6D6553
MVRLKFSISLNYEIKDSTADFIFNLHAARNSSQTVVQETLYVSQAVPLQHVTDHLGNRFMRLKAGQGPLMVRYEATVDIAQVYSLPSSLGEAPIAQLPMAVLPYIYPSRYCQSDQMTALATREFGHLRQGYVRAQAIHDWVQSHTKFTSMSSNSSTSALDTLSQHVGVCRDFAHLMIALCRAVNLPARFATGIDYGADPALGPTDFHAYVEVFVGGRWYIFDPSGTAIPMGFVRIGTGRDAVDVAFSTIFGTVTSEPPQISIVALTEPGAPWLMPFHRTDAVSTAGEYPM